MKTQAKPYLSMLSEDNLTIQDVLLDILDINRCGLTREECAHCTKTNYTVVTRYINGDTQPHLEWIALLGRYVADRYGDYRIARWIAQICLPTEMYVELEDAK